MRFLFISKPQRIEPLGIMHLSAALKAAGHEVGLALVSADLAEKAAAFRPDVIGYSMMTGDHLAYDKINRELKSGLRFYSIAGGPHPTFFPEFLESSSLDAICRGEAELALPDFLQGPFSERTENFWVKKDGAILRNPVRELIDPLDAVPPPDREIFRAFGAESPIRHFLASRGCPFDCSYCFNEQYAALYGGKGRRVRNRAVDELLLEIARVVREHPTRFVYFQDDTFALNAAWLEEFAAKYPKAVGLPFHCHVRPNTVSESHVRLLKQAGCYSAHIAAETGNDDLRNRLLRRNMSTGQILSAAELLRRHGIRFMLQSMIGLPEGSLKTDMETLELNISCRPDYAWVSIFQPYPGTWLGKLCQEKGYYRGDFGDLGANFFDSSRLEFPPAYRSQLAHLQKLFAVFVENPELYEAGLLPGLINAPQDEATGEAYRKAYAHFRRLGDRRLYGFDL